MPDCTAATVLCPSAPQLYSVSGLGPICTLYFTVAVLTISQGNNNNRGRPRVAIVQQK